MRSRQFRQTVAAPQIKEGQQPEERSQQQAGADFAGSLQFFQREAAMERDHADHEDRQETGEKDQVERRISGQM